MNAARSRRSFLTAAGVLSLTGVAGCGIGGIGGAGTGGKPTLREFWSGSQETNRIFLSVIKAFEKAYPDIEIRPEYGAGDAAADKLATQIAGGRAPDLIVASRSLLSEYAERGVIFPLDDYKPKPINVADFDERVVANATIDGKLYALPLGVNAPGLIYNATMFDRAKVPPPPPEWTWNDFAETADELARALGGDFAGSEDAGGSRPAFELFIRQRGKELYDGDTIGFDADDLGDWLEFWSKLRASGGIVSPDVQALYDEMANSPLIKGSAPMLFAQADNILGAQPLIKDKLDLHLYPRTAGDAPIGFYLVSNTMLVGSARTKFKEAAVTAIGAMMTEPKIAKFNMVEHGMPPSSAVRELVQAELDEDGGNVFAFIQDFADIATDPPPPGPPGNSEVEDILNRTNVDLAFQRLDVKSAVERFFKGASAAIRKE